MICRIFGAGERCADARISVDCPGDFVIAADGGLSWLEKLERKAHLTVGDFDSYDKETPGNARIFPVRKDDTDMGIAVWEGFSRGYRIFELYGGTGGRADHTMANYQLLKKIAVDGGSGYLIGPEMTATVIKNGELCFHEKKSGTISVFSMDEVSEGVEISGLSYPLVNGTLTNCFALGVSNSFVGAKSRISVKKGTLLIIGEFLPKDIIRQEEKSVEMVTSIQDI